MSDIKTTKYIVSQYRIEYNADMIYRIDLCEDGLGRSQITLHPSEIVNNAKKVAEDEGRTFIDIRDAFPKVEA